MLPIELNAIFMRLARLPMPAAELKLISAKIRAYSTRPWPDSSREKHSVSFVNECMISTL